MLEHVSSPDFHECWDFLLNDLNFRRMLPRDLKLQFGVVVYQRSVTSSEVAHSVPVTDNYLHLEFLLKFLTQKIGQHSIVVLYYVEKVHSSIIIGLVHEQHPIVLWLTCLIRINKSLTTDKRLPSFCVCIQFKIYI